MKKGVLLFEGKRSLSQTKQCFRDSVNINTIMAKAKRTGILPIKTDNGVFGDYSNVVDYRDCLDKIMNIEALFLRLPAAVRNKFQNDPGALLSFLQDPKNEDEARKLGLLRPLTDEERIARGEMTADGKPVEKKVEEPEPQKEGGE